jgi:hypothetical protein
MLRRAPKISSSVTSEAMDDPKRQQLQSAAFADVETMIGNSLMRPLSLASYDVLLRTNNPLVKGEMPEEGTPEFTSALMGFVFVHCAPWPDVVRASFDDHRFREEALIYCGDFTPSDFHTAFKRLEEQSKQLEAAQVEPASELGGKKPSRATNRGS